jgi:hypothetical protein
VADFAPPDDEYPPVNQARCSNKLLEHLEHLRETNDLFGNLAKSQYEGKWMSLLLKVIAEGIDPDAGQLNPFVIPQPRNRVPAPTTSFFDVALDVINSVNLPDSAKLSEFAHSR